MSDVHHPALGPRALGLLRRRIRFIRRYPPVRAAHVARSTGATAVAARLRGLGPVSYEVVRARAKSRLVVTVDADCATAHLAGKPA